MNVMVVPFVLTMHVQSFVVNGHEYEQDECWSVSATFL